MDNPSLEKLEVAKPLTKFPTFYRTQIFILVVTNHHPQPHECNLYPPTLPVKWPVLRNPLKHRAQRYTYSRIASIKPHSFRMTTFNSCPINPMQLLRKKTGTSTTMTA